MATAANSMATGRLQVLRDPANASQECIDVVLVPGIGTIPPDNWSFANQNWLATLPEPGSRARILHMNTIRHFQTPDSLWSQF